MSSFFFIRDGVKTITEIKNPKSEKWTNQKLVKSNEYNI